MTIAHRIARRLASLATASVLLIVTAAQAQTVIYYHTDALGSPVATTDAAGNVLERSEYEPYGQVLNHPVADGPGYTGHVSDAQTGLSYMQQRYYDPMIGRFLSMDPVTANTNTGTNFNRYGYANNNPYRFTDPDGRAPVVVPIIVGARICWAVASCRTTVIRWVGAAAAGILGTREGIRQANESAESGNSNPYNGPVNEPVVVVDGDGNAIPVDEGEQISSSPNGKYQQVKDRDGQPTGTRMDKGGHRGHADPKAQAPHAHRPGVTDETGNPHLPINPPKPREDEQPERPEPPEKPLL